MRTNPIFQIPMTPQTTAIRALRAAFSLLQRPAGFSAPLTRASRSWIMVALFTFSSIGLSACVLDFDEFEQSNGAISDAATNPDATEDTGDTDPFDTGQGDTDQGDATQSDADANGGDSDSENGPNSPVIGATCTDDSDCGDGGLCRQNYCTTDCSGGTSCQQGSSCQPITRGSFAGEQLCVLECEPGDASACGERDDLGCMAVNNLPDDLLGTDIQRACLADRDDDQVSDLVDNCPDTANPEQLDFDADGIGNACDPEPSCHDRAVDGVLDYGSIDYAATDYTFPESTNQNWLPIFGGSDAQGDQVATLRILNRTSGTWETAPDLPFAAYERQAAWAGDGEYWITPGSISPGGERFDQPIYVARDAKTRLAQTFASPYRDPIVTAATTSHDQIFLHGYNNYPPPSQLWRIIRIDLNPPVVSTVNAGVRPELTDWHSTQTHSGGVLFYSATDSSVAATNISYSDAFGKNFRTVSLNMPSRAEPDPSPLSPFVIPAGGDYIFVMGRETGTMLRVSLTTQAQHTVPDLKFDLEDLNSPQFISTPASSSFIALDRPIDAPDKLRAREYFLACMPTLSDHDSDADTVADLLDNCPQTDNPAQEDLDNDRIGDACDPDTDGDGISDQNEATDETDPNDPLSFAGAGYLTYIRDDGSTRTLEYAALAELDAPTALTSTEVVDPHNPQFVGTKSLIMTLSGVPDSATAVDIFSIYGDTPSIPTTVELGAPLRAATIFDASYTGIVPPQITAIRANASRPGTWLLSDISTGTDTTLSTANRNTSLPELRRLDSNGKESATFLGGPSDCEACLSGYLVNGASISKMSWTQPPPTVRDVRIDTNGAVAAILSDQDTSGSIGWFQNNAYRPPGRAQLNSFISTGYGTNLIASARRDSASPYELWFYNSRTQSWHLLASAAEDLIEIDWVSEIPDPSDVVIDPNEPVE